MIAGSFSQLNDAVAYSGGPERDRAYRLDGVESGIMWRGVIDLDGLTLILRSPCSAGSVLLDRRVLWTGFGYSGTVCGTAEQHGPSGSRAAGCLPLVRPGLLTLRHLHLPYPATDPL